MSSRNKLKKPKFNSLAWFTYLEISVVTVSFVTGCYKKLIRTTCLLIIKSGSEIRNKV